MTGKGVDLENLSKNGIARIKLSFMTFSAKDGDIFLCNWMKEHENLCHRWKSIGKQFFHSRAVADE